MGGMIEILPNANNVSPKDVTFLASMMPMLHIKTINYENKDCYSLKLEDQIEIIEKDTGLILYGKYNTEERKVKYSFDTVTDKDVEKPDITEYKLKNN